MEIGIYHALPQGAAEVRRIVFMEEQGFVEEFDEIDGLAIHFLMCDGQRPVATCRLFADDATEQGWILGRFAVLREYRGQQLGRRLMEAVETHIKALGGKHIRLHAQCRVREFYGSLGFEAYGAVEPEEGCPHIWMKKTLAI